jgi:DNA-binding NarL/FixJ family response regulator
MRVADRCYALVIVDAEVAGLSLIGSLRRASTEPRTRYIAISGKADAATVLAVKAASVSGFLLKPYSLAQLSRVVSRAVGQISRAA